MSEIKIQSLGIKGDGVGTLSDGRRVFVAGALPGEIVRVVAGKENPEGVTGKLVEIIKPSPERAEPPCGYFGTCGGCALQHMNPESYRQYKVTRVMEALSRAGLAAERAEEAPFISPSGSRRRAVFSAKCATAGKVEVGFNERGSHRLAAIENCAVLRPALVALLPALREYLPRIMQPGESYDLAIAEAGGRADLLITVLGKEGRECGNDIRMILQELARAGNITRIAWQSGRFNKVDTVMKGAYQVSLSGFNVVPPPGAFLQATEEGEKALTEFAVAGVGKKSKVADLYAGCGTFAFALLAQGHSVDAYEGDAAALDALAKAGTGNANLRAMKRDLAREPLTFQELKTYDAVVIDPPRAGALKQAEAIVKSSVSKVVSISCNPDTFARDGAVLAQAGFRLKRLRVVDQFLWAPHVEIAGLFVR